MGYSDEVKDIRKELVDRLKGITVLGSRVFKGLPKSTNVFPTAFVNFSRDDAELINTSGPLYRHDLTFEIMLKDKWSRKPEEDVDTLVERVGLIIDKLKDYTTNPPKWDLLRINNVEYVFQTRRGRGSYVLLDTLITITVSKKW